MTNLEGTRYRIAVLTPAMDMCHTEFAFSLIQMVQRTYNSSAENIEALVCQAYGTSMLPHSRNVLAQFALDCKITHALWIDSDMKFPPDTLIRLMAHQTPVVGINAIARRPPYRFTAQSGPDEETETAPASTGLESVYRMGMGIVWMNMEVFQKIKRPWFEYQWLADQLVHRGEDYVFFEKVKAAGYDIQIDHDLSKEVDHLGLWGFNPQMKSFGLGTQ